MIRPRPCFSSAATVAILVALTGCRDVLGFKESTALQALCASSDDCLPNESCAGQTCHARCRNSTDCQGNEACVSVADVSSPLCMAPDAGASDASVEAAAPVGTGGADSAIEAARPISPDGADSASEGSDGSAADDAADGDGGFAGPACDADLTSDPQNCGTCGTSCAAPNVCLAGGCRQVTYAGQQAPGNHYVGIAPDTFSSVQIHVGEDAWAIAIGLIASEANPAVIPYPNAYLGIYDDTGGGSPAGLHAAVAGGSSVAVMPGRNEFAFSAPVRLVAGYYWLAGVFDNSMPFDAQDGLTSTWNYADLHSFELPPTAPPPNALSAVGSLAPNFYVVLAQ